MKREQDRGNKATGLVDTLSNATTGIQAIYLQGCKQ